MSEFEFSEAASDWIRSRESYAIKCTHREPTRMLCASCFGAALAELEVLRAKNADLEGRLAKAEAEGMTDDWELHEWRTGKRRTFWRVRHGGDRKRFKGAVQYVNDFFTRADARTQVMLVRHAAVEQGINAKDMRVTLYRVTVRPKLKKVAK